MCLKLVCWLVQHLTWRTLCRAVEAGSRVQRQPAAAFPEGHKLHLTVLFDQWCLCKQSHLRAAQAWCAAPCCMSSTKQCPQLKHHAAALRRQPTPAPSRACKAYMHCISAGDKLCLATAGQSLPTCYPGFSCMSMFSMPCGM